MTRVFVDVGVSLDGFLAGPNRGPANPLGDGFQPVHAWMFDKDGFRSDGPEGEMLQAMFARTGAYLMGRNMFEEGAPHWGETTFRGCPVFVVTHRAREPWARPGGTTFHFVTEGFDGALAQARAAAGERDVRILGGADIIRQSLEAGAVDEMTLHVAPVLVGEGLRLFEGLGRAALTVQEPVAAVGGSVAHLTIRPGA